MRRGRASSVKKRPVCVPRPYQSRRGASVDPRRAILVQHQHAELGDFSDAVGIHYGQSDLLPQPYARLVDARGPHQDRCFWLFC